jgi:hypothetical protein
MLGLGRYATLASLSLRDCCQIAVKLVAGIQMVFQKGRDNFNRLAADMHITFRTVEKAADGFGSVRAAAA